ncbi:insulinase family protein [Pyxidicoccus fallax]|uniref:Insulinase family protein n=1 Tax=Pyxidicoccus fallax TaxID=394095 RepID=A0A848LZI9_9BACT|nr:insulinase family protein [Pyxidicoccus fallax]NMO23505.1 insulinase family protein [Pyxidicoccus fallax]NPC86788.1 insulinase family protein [Pyxidicoccus fallax]
MMRLSHLAPLVVLLLLLAPPVLAAPFEVETFRPSAQHPLLLLAPRESDSATLTVIFDVGAMDDGHERGLTRVTQHALLHSNARIDYEKWTLSGYGAAATFEMHTGLHESRFTLTAPAGSFDALARTLLTAILSPRIEERRFEAALDRGGNDSQPLDPSVWLELLLVRTLLDEPRYKQPGLGSLAKIEGMPVETVREHLSKLVAPCNATVIATGRFNAKALRSIVSGVRGGVPNTHKRPELKLPFKRLAPAPREVQVLAYPIRIETPRHAAAARVLASLLEERLFQRFRDAGVGYGFASEPLFTTTLDALALILPAAEKSGIDLSPFLREEVRAVSEGQLEPGAFERHQQSTLIRLRLADKDAPRVAEELRAARQRPSWYGPALPDALAALTPDALREVAASWLREESSIQIHFVTRMETRE